jgi:hypothetical protein
VSALSSVAKETPASSCELGIEVAAGDVVGVGRRPGEAAERLLGEPVQPSLNGRRAKLRVGIAYDRPAGFAPAIRRFSLKDGAAPSAGARLTRLGSARKLPDHSLLVTAPSPFRLAPLGPHDIAPAIYDSCIRAKDQAPALWTTNSANSRDSASLRWR